MPEVSEVLMEVVEEDLEVEEVVLKHLAEVEVEKVVVLGNLTGEVEVLHRDLHSLRPPFARLVPYDILLDRKLVELYGFEIKSMANTVLS